MKTLMDHIQEFARDTISQLLKDVTEEQLEELRNDIMDDSAIDSSINKLESDILYDVTQLVKSIIYGIWSPKTKEEDE